MYKNLTQSSLAKVKVLPKFALKLLLAAKNINLGFLSFGGFLYTPFKLEEVFETQITNEIDGDYISDVIPSNGVTVSEPYSILQVPSFEFNLLDTCYDKFFDFKVIYKFEGLIRERFFVNWLYYPGWRPLIGYSNIEGNTYYLYHNMVEETDPPAQDYQNINYTWSVGNQVISRNYNITYTFPESPGSSNRLRMKAIRPDGIEGCSGF